ncbi:MAG: DinB family protein [Anaerolineae bacterium]|nr:DinB family protein [Anaerolineae bacterium]
MTHPLVTQLRFARSEFQRGLEGVTAEEAVRRFLPMNCISWMVGHLAAQEHFYWVWMGHGEQVVSDELLGLVAYGQPASTPPLNEMWAMWHTVTTAADRFLDTITGEVLYVHMDRRGRPDYEDIGTRLLRNTYHYFFHLGEAQGIRQMLGHTGLPEFVGDMAAIIHSVE